MLKEAMWITPEADFGEVCPTFCKNIQVKGGLRDAALTVTATGVYEAYIEGKRVGEYILAPGWTNYERRLQYQTYCITDLLKEGDNALEISVGSGWYRGKITRDKTPRIWTTPNIIAEITLIYENEAETVFTDLSWQSKKSPVRASDIYDGEVYDANAVSEMFPVKKASANKTVLIPQEGEEIREQETLIPIRSFKTPKGEWVIDFGQEITGYISVALQAKKGEEIVLSFAEVLDKDGNFYNENYREALCRYRYICKDGWQSYKPHFTFYGFRYIRVDQCPAGTKADDFKAIVVHSQIRRTGWLETRHKNVNRLFENIIWGQKGNFLDVPTDCPQRNERLGWTGDAQVFAKTACYQYDVHKFFRKWLRDMQTEQRFDGQIPFVVPDVLYNFKQSINALNASAAWGDAAVICPWQVYEVYGDTDVLQECFPMMQKWVAYMESTTDDPHLWTGHSGYGDWLGLDAGEGNYRGATDQDFVSSAYYKYTTQLVAKAAKVIGRDYRVYEEKTAQARAAFIERFPVFKTQTEHVLALFFDLTDRKKETADALHEMIVQNGTRLTTGFVGTPYLLFALSDNGYAETAYQLLLQNQFPSWLYAVEKGATTIWEHWDGIKEDGSFWSKDMNSFNHYAYGAVAQWVFEVAAGIKMTGEGLEIAPVPNRLLGDLKAVFDSRYGKVMSAWEYTEKGVRYELEIPVSCKVTLHGETKILEKGKYILE